MSISVLYGRDISKDFTMEFNFATGRIGKPGAAWDGNFSLPSDSVLKDSGQIPERHFYRSGPSSASFHGQVLSRDTGRQAR